MKLYTYFRSSAAYRVRIALNLKNLPYEAAFVHLARNVQSSPDYLAKNPYGLIPLLEDSDHSLSQSLAIMEYLDETHPEPAFLPKDPLSRAQVRAMALAIACDIHPLNNLRVLRYLKNELGQEQASIDAWYRHWVSEGFKGLEAMVQPAATGPAYCFGPRVTLADICLVPQMYNARRLNTDLAPFPKLVAIDAALQKLKAFSDAAPEVQPDAE